MTNQKEIMDKIKAIFSGHITDLEVKEIMDIFDEYKLEVRESTLEEVKERLELDNIKIWDGELHIAEIVKGKINSLRST